MALIQNESNFKPGDNKHEKVDNRTRLHVMMYKMFQ